MVGGVQQNVDAVEYQKLLDLITHGLSAPKKAP